MRYIPTVSIDFDGVLHSYTSPWTTGSEINDGPTPGALEAVQSYINAGLRVIVCSARVKDEVDEGYSNSKDGTSKERVNAVEAWLEKHGFPKLKVTAEKPEAILYIDDRGYMFKGDNWPCVGYIKTFRPWNRGGLPGEQDGWLEQKRQRVRMMREVLEEADVPDSELPDLLQNLFDLLKELGL